MKRFFGLTLTLAALGACTTYQDGEPDDSANASEANAEDLCGAAALQDYVGKAGDDANKAALEAAAPEGFRWIPFNSMITQDFRPDRLNVSLAEDGTIEGISCF